MDFKELEYVLSIARNNSISKASRELYISQPSLSKYLQNLEKNLNLKLFHRMGNNYILTYAGEKYINCAREILKLKKGLNDELFDILNQKKGRLVVGCSIIRSPYLIPDTVPEFKRQYPNVDINFIEIADANRLSRLVESGDADLAIFNYSGSSPMLEGMLLKNEEIVLVAGREHPLANEGRSIKGCSFPWIDINRFNQDSFIINYADTKSGEITENIFETLNFKPNVALKTRSVECAVRLVSHGFGVCFSSETHLKYMHLENKPVYFSIGNPRISTDLYAVYRKDSYVPQYLQDYIEIVKKVI